MGIDIDPETIAIARSLSGDNANANVEFYTAALTEVAGAGYDVVTAITVVHHLDLSEALTAMRRLTKPGGKLLIVGCYRSATASGYLINVVAIPANLLAGLLKSRHASSARIAMSARTAPTCTTLGQVRKVVADVLPGAQVRGPLVLEVHPQLHGRLNRHSLRRPSDSHRMATGMSHCPRQPDRWSPQADPHAQIVPGARWL
jgi:SAM-dependent methyltransferase